MDGQITLIFLGNNNELLRLEAAGGILHYPLSRRASIKDIIEAVGVPHTEVCRLEYRGAEISFQYIPSGGEKIRVVPFDIRNNWRTPSVLRPEPFAGPRFLVDKTALKLARDLRMLGIDTEIVRQQNIKETVKRANLDERVVLTRNRNLLKISDLHFGQLLRSEDHREQLLEVEVRYELSTMADPLTRCMVCNEILHFVEKEAIEHRLEPLTRKYYATFKECGSCRRIYWRGSHHDRMTRLFDFLQVD
jgi:uncharacterized protein with PIN domain